MSLEVKTNINENDNTAKIEIMEERIDGKNFWELGEILDAKAETYSMQINMINVKYMTSAAAGVMMNAYDICMEKNNSFSLINVHKSVTDILGNLGFDCLWYEDIET